LEVWILLSAFHHLRVDAEQPVVFADIGFQEGRVRVGRIYVQFRQWDPKYRNIKGGNIGIRAVAKLGF
jgi:hypothetical protein